MPVSATCPHCGKIYNLDDSLMGKKARCKQCKNVFAIPGGRSSAATAPAPVVAATATATPAVPPPLPTAAPGAGAPRRSSEVSAGGIPIIRHPGEQRRATSPETAPPPAAPKAPAATPYLEQIVAHVEQTMGARPRVYPDRGPEAIKLDLLIVPPTHKPPSEEYPLGTDHFTIVTAGLSAKPQAVPAEARQDISPLQELMIALPGNWPGLNPDGTLDKDLMSDERHGWPIGFLKMVARMPAEYETFLAPGVTIPNGEEAEPFADNTKLGCMMAFLPMLCPGAAQLQIDAQTRIDFFALWPLYPEEMKLKLDKGLEPLLKKLMEAEVSELIVVDRPNLCKKKGWFGR